MNFDKVHDSWLVKLSNQLIICPEVKDEVKKIYKRTQEEIIANIVAKSLLELKESSEKGLTLIFLKYNENKSYKEIARIFGYSTKEIKQDRKWIVNELKKIERETLNLVRNDIIRGLYHFENIKLDEVKDDLVKFGPLGGRISNALLRYDRNITIRDLKSMSKEDMFKIRGIGEKTYLFLKEFLDKY